MPIDLSFDSLPHLTALNEGHKIRRSDWPKHYILNKNRMVECVYCGEDGACKTCKGKRLNPFEWSHGISGWVHDWEIVE